MNFWDVTVLFLHFSFQSFFLDTLHEGIVTIPCSLLVTMHCGILCVHYTAYHIFSLHLWTPLQNGQAPCQYIGSSE